ncbi:MAG: GNAT family N-acetyltransferase [Saprospiraceae bacterium]
MQIRKAQFSDWPHLLDWRNDERTRKNADNDSYVTETEHKNWLKKVLTKENFRLYIALNNNIPVGTIRSEFNSETYTSKVSWTIAPAHRSKGFGKQMVKQYLANASENIHIEIKNHDLFSQKIAKRLNLQFDKEVDGKLHYSRRRLEESKIILFLGYDDSPLIHFLKTSGEQVIQKEDKVTVDFLKSNDIDFIVSYGYKHIIKKEILDFLPGKVINLHISYLPWNKGADPNFWSIVEETPSGVTIHQVDVGLDTGDILLQNHVCFSETDTLRTSYLKLQHEIQYLFKTNWQRLKTGQITPKSQVGQGSYHRSKDKNKYIEDIKNEWLALSIPKLKKYINETFMEMIEKSN